MPVMDIDVAALDRLLTTPEQSDDVILDTRDRGVAARWHPEGPGARDLNVPYDDFEGDQDAAVAQLPENARNIHVLCARGDLLAAQLAADRAVFVERVSSAVAKTSQPAEYAEIRRVNLGADASEQRLAELETGVNQCALKR
jgi:hypothetical protein